MTTRFPTNESERIAELSRLCVADSESHEALDVLVRLVKTVLEAEMVAVSLVDADRCRFLSRAGFVVPEVLRPRSPCSRVVMHNDAVFVADLTSENRFGAYSIGGPIAAYAGIPLRGPTGQPVGALAVMSRTPRVLSGSQERLLRDFACQAQAHLRGIGTRQRLVQSTAQVEETRRLLSHDFKAPSRQVRSLLELIGNGEGRDVSHIVALAKRSAATMQCMVDGFYEYSCVVPGGDVTPVRLADAVGRAWRACHPSPSARLSVAVDEVVLPCRGGALQRVLERVVDNALRHAGRDDVIVDVSATRLAGRWHVSVADNGQGVPPRLCDAAFLMYRRLHRDNDRGGVGVGLAIAQRLVLDAGATIAIESDGKNGTTVLFSWPALPEAYEQPTVAANYESIAS